jgi:hypothetical protein
MPRLSAAPFLALAVALVLGGLVLDVAEWIVGLWRKL